MKVLGENPRRDLTGGDFWLSARLSSRLATEETRRSASMSEKCLVSREGEM